jgi:flagellar hook-associated protein 2
MSGITTGIGLVSGLPIADIVDQLMGIEARPKQRVEFRNEQLKEQREVLKDINTKLLSLKLNAAKLTLPTGFKQTQATSSNESVLSITSGAAAVQGNYSFIVNRLVQAQQTITRGFAEANNTPVAPAGGTLTFERGEARLDSTTLLSQLNGGAGIARGLIRITDGSGASATIDLRSVATVNDVLEKINSTAGISVFADVDGDRLRITDVSGQSTSNLIVGDVGTTGTASSLGIAASTTTGSITGSVINSVGEGTLLSSLNDANGIRQKRGVADFRIALGGGNYDINLDGASTIGDVIRRIEDATGGAVTGGATPDGVSLRLTGPAGFTVAAVNGSQAAEDLGILGAADGSGNIDGRRLLAGINSKLLRNLQGGNGVSLGTMSITNRAGATTSVNLAGAQSVSEVLERINDAGAGVRASLNAAGNGIQLTDTSGGAGSLTIGGADDLGLTGTHTGSTVNGGNLQFKYISEGTRLDTLGISRGRFTITDSSGVTATIDLTQGDEQTLGDVISEINSKGLRVNARINDNGDGILIEDTGPGVVAMRIADLGSTTAADLNLVGEASAPGENIDGSFQKTIVLDGTESLRDIATKITEAKLGLSASIISDGSAGTPFRLSISAKTPGTAGAFVFDDGGIGLNPTNLAEAQDAVVFYGSSDPARALVITSKTNTIKGLIPGTTIDLKSTSSEPVQVTVSADQGAMVEAVQSFIESFNAVTTLINEVDAYDVETNTRGVLLGDPAVAAVRSNLFNMILRRNTDLTSRYNSLAQIGITVGANSQLELNEDRLRAALDTDIEAVEQLFKFRKTETDADGKVVTVARGIGVAIDEMLNRLTDPEFGPLTSRMNTLDTQVRINDRRIKDLDGVLEQKRMRLERQFQAMERALADMQNQAGAISGLQQIVANMRPPSRNNGGNR